ncbi:MAG: hypothetical protein JO257_27885 [Deltaproteobacteria bacterium]|nr:hypothetical protein [Deltaproteobacteria bacterium]
MRKLGIVVVLMACGDDGGRHTPDATPHADGAVDSAADAPVAPVTIAAIRDQQPVMGVHVYFQNADSSVVLATTTDANGIASAVMAPGGYVTAVNPFTLPALGGVQQDELDTFVGVKPGDHLVLKRVFVATTQTMTVTAPLDANMTGFAAYSPCNTTGTQLAPPPSLMLVQGAMSGSMSLNNCGAATDVLVVASNGSASEYVYASNLPVVDQGTLDLSGGTYVAATSRTLMYTNIPAAQSVSFQDNLIDPMGPIFTILNETPAGSAASSTFDVPLFTGASDVLETFFNDRSWSRQILLDWGALGSAYSADVGSRALNDFTGPPAFDPSTKQASVPVDTTTGGAPDFSIFFMTASRSTTRRWQWSVAAPWGANVTLPTVPTDVFDFNIGSGDTVGINGWVTGKVPGGYDAVRSLLLSTSGPQDIAIGNAGMASFVQSQQPLTIARSLRHRWH